jgi:RNA polymerase sigma-70 factor (ECF subfamily)
MTGEEPATDGELVRRVLEGHGGAFTELVDRHAASCLRFAARMLGNREDAEDATQETLMRAYRALRVYDGRTAFRTWLFTILVNRCRTSLLHRARRERRIVVDDERIGRASADGRYDAVELRLELARALAVLPSEQREAFLLKHVEQLEYAEMSAITGHGVSALKMRVRRACTRLRAELRGLDDA